MNEQVEIATMIKSQISKRELMAIGATKLMALSRTDSRLGGLQFKASLFGSKQCQVRIELNNRDLYNVTLLSARGANVLAYHTDVFCEDLESKIILDVERKFAN